jgi:hypothetical protein
MDPLSILASAITLSAAISASLERLRAFHAADRELQNIINEVSDVRVVFSFIEETLEERKTCQPLSPDRLQGLSTLLGSAKATLTTVDQIVNDRLIRKDVLGGEPKAARLSWLKRRNKLKNLLEELRSTRNNISAIWSALNV